MERDELIKKINSVSDPSKDRQTIYDVLTELGVSFKRTNCKKCLNDLKHIAEEELGLVGNAADFSDFNDEDFDYVYICDLPQSWRGYIIDQNTPVDVIRDFIKSHPKGYYSKQYKLEL